MWKCNHDKAPTFREREAHVINESIMVASSSQKLSANGEAVIGEREREREREMMMEERQLRCSSSGEEYPTAVFQRRCGRAGLRGYKAMAL